MVKVSVLIVTYNAIWEKLESTIKSVVFQKYIELEIIFADDGSGKKWDKEIENLLRVLNFKNYKFKNSQKNVGTVKNIYNALSVAEGKYIKVISPGDFFYSETALKSWVAYMESTKADISFGNAVYYKKGENGIHQIETIPAPTNIEVFEKKKEKELFIDYLLVNDTILGAAIFVRRDIIQKYLEYMVDKVKYAEDYMVRLMIYEGKRVNYFPEKMIWYEYGEGISTTQDSKWGKLLKKDFDASNRILMERGKVTNKISARYKKFLQIKFRHNITKKIVKAMMFPSVFYWRMKMQYNIRKTPIDGNTEFLTQIL